MINVRVDAALGEQSKNVQASFTAARMLHGREQNGVAEELAILDHQVDARDVHVNDAPGTDVEMADLAITHLAVGQADIVSAGLDERVGILVQQAVVIGLASKRNGIGLGFGAVSPAIEDDEDERFGTDHVQKRSLVNWERSIRISDFDKH